MWPGHALIVAARNAHVFNAAPRSSPLLCALVRDRAIIAGMTQADSPATRPSPETWERVRADYMSGVGAPVLGERYGVTVRSIRRRAAIEGWRRTDFAPSGLGPPPPWMRAAPSKEVEMDEDPALEDIEEAESTSRFALLFNPDPRSFRRFAFRQAAENAAIDQPQQSLAWMRLVHMAERCMTSLETDATAFRQIDHVRAAYLRRLNEGLRAEEAEMEEEARRTGASESPEIGSP